MFGRKREPEPITVVTIKIEGKSIDRAKMAAAIKAALSKYDGKNFA